MSSWDPGHASTALAAIALFLTITLIVVIFVAERFVGFETNYAVLGGLWVVLGPGLHIVGLGFGIEGLVKNRQKIWALTGAGLNAVLLLFWTVAVPLIVSSD